MAKKITSEENLEPVTDEAQQLPAEEISADEKKESPLKAIVKSISELSQTDRLVLYGRLDKLAYHDRDRMSGGLESDPAIFEQAINSL